MSYVRLAHTAVQLERHRVLSALRVIHSQAQASLVAQAVLQERTAQSAQQAAHHVLLVHLAQQLQANAHHASRVHTVMLVLVHVKVAAATVSVLQDLVPAVLALPVPM